MCSFDHISTFVKIWRHISMWRTHFPVKMRSLPVHDTIFSDCLVTLQCIVLVFVCSWGFKVCVHVYRPLVHLFGHTQQSAEVLSKHGVLFSNGSQFAGLEVTWPNIIDVYVRPELPSKTKIYKLPVWKEAESSVHPTSADADQHATTSSKSSCSLQWLLSIV